MLVASRAREGGKGESSSPKEKKRSDPRETGPLRLTRQGKGRKEKEESATLYDRREKRASRVKRNSACRSRERGEREENLHAGGGGKGRPARRHLVP